MVKIHLRLIVTTEGLVKIQRGLAEAPSTGLSLSWCFPSIPTQFGELCKPNPTIINRVGRDLEQRASSCLSAALISFSDIFPNV